MEFPFATEMACLAFLQSWILTSYRWCSDASGSCKRTTLGTRYPTFLGMHTKDRTRLVMESTSCQVMIVMSCQCPTKGRFPLQYSRYTYIKTLLFKQSSHLFWVCKNPSTPLVEIPAGVETSRDSLSFLPRPKIIPVTVTWRHGTWLCWNQQVMWASPCRGSAVPLVFWRWGCWWYQGSSMLGGGMGLRLGDVVLVMEGAYMSYS